MSSVVKRLFAERLRYARESLRGITQGQLAEKAGIPATSISHFESLTGSRKPSFDNLRRLAKALEVSTDYLLGNSEDPIGNTVDDILYRNVQNLTESDRQFAKEMIQKILEKNQKKDK